jgi:hypothetical protein
MRTQAIEIRSSGLRTGAIVLLAALVGACGSGGEEAAAPAPAPQVRKPDAAPAPVDPTAKMARAVTIGKSTVPLDLKYEIAAKPIVSQPMEMDLAFVPTRGADSMSMAFAPSTGLTLSADSAPTLEAVKAGQAHHVKLTAMADKPDVFYVTVTATLYSAGVSSIRTFAIPLIVSEPAPPAVEAGAEPKKS